MNEEYNTIREANRANWDSRVPIHLKSKTIYNLDDFKKGKSSFVAKEDIELQEYLDLKGKSLLHLQCHFGVDTMSFSRMGVEATGVDFSSVAIHTANKLKKELNLSTRFIEADIYDLPNILDEKFDIVFSSCGVLAWLPDLVRWGKVISHFLKPGGIFYLKESHPIQHTFDYEAEGVNDLKIKFPYSEFGKAQFFEEPYTYAHDGTEDLVENKITYQFDHRLDEIITAIIYSGMKITNFRESTIGFYQALKFLEFDGEGGWRFPFEHKGLFPLTFTIFATK